MDFINDTLNVKAEPDIRDEGQTVFKDLQQNNQKDSFPKNIVHIPQSHTHNTITTDNVGNPFECSICHKFFTTVSEIVLHSHIHAGMKPTKCDICHKPINVRGRLTKHMRIHLKRGEKPFKCDICLKRFNAKCALTKHTRSHTPYECDICHKRFKQMRYLNSHKGIVHKHTATMAHKNGEFDIKDKPEYVKVESVTCDMNQFKYTSSLINNLFECSICHKQFSDVSEIAIHAQTHMSAHTGEKPYKCGICHERFAIKNNLTIHMRTHIREKPRRCGICQKWFITKYDFTQHMRTHTGQKQCHLCTHTTEKPCHKRFKENRICNLDTREKHKSVATMVYERDVTIDIKEEPLNIKEELFQQKFE